jgi:predicted AlkP superfamily phosphohydrolase/phosphomutase
MLQRDERRFDYTAQLLFGLLEQGTYDLVVFYTPWTDVFNHRLSHAQYRQMLEGRFEGELPAQFAATYEKLDGFLGTLRERLPEANFVVLSDHGVAPIYSVTKAVSGSRVRFLEPADEATLPAHLRQRTDLGHLHARQGMFLAFGPDVKAGRRGPTSMYDVAPTILAYLGVPLARDFRGSTIPELVSAPAAGLVESYAASVANERVDVQRSLTDEAAERLRALGYIE